MVQQYDCHTHVASKEDLFFYYRNKVIPIINAASIEEYQRIRLWQAELEACYQKQLPIYVSIGAHPFDGERFTQNFGQDYELFLAEADFVGEIGRDSVWSDVPLEIQEQHFEDSLRLARRYHKPIILHTKGQEKEVLQQIRNYPFPIVVHWYSCVEYVSDYLALGAYFTVGPAVITDEAVQWLVQTVPLEHLLLETDGREALEWLYEKQVSDDDMWHVMEATIGKIASLIGKESSFVAAALSENAKKLLTEER